jgi:hypothetical protein
MYTNDFLCNKSFKKIKKNSYAVGTESLAGVQQQGVALTAHHLVLMLKNV